MSAYLIWARLGSSGVIALGELSDGWRLKRTGFRQMRLLHGEGGERDGWIPLSLSLFLSVDRFVSVKTELTVTAEVHNRRRTNAQARALRRPRRERRMMSWMFLRNTISRVGVCPHAQSNFSQLLRIPYGELILSYSQSRKSTKN